jgi:hypothetical protein
MELSAEKDMTAQMSAATDTQANETSWLTFYGRFFLSAALLLLLAGTALRMYHLGDRSLWFDEAVTANTSRGTLTQMLEETRARLTSPIIYPCILYLVERVSKTAVAVRMPSVLASLLAILVILTMVRAKVSRSAVLFSAAVLTFSASQIRYAQEVREYSLSVLWAAILISCLLSWEASGSRDRHPIWLYVALFIAPLIQYGLVFLAFGIIATIVLRLLLTRGGCFTRSHAAIATLSLIAGALLSFALTLRYLYHPGQVFWYLAPNYFDPKSNTLLHFVFTNTNQLLSFLMPEHIVRLLFLVGAVIFCIAQARSRKVDSITLLLFTTTTIMICASVARMYPYGGIRQCLFLAPLFALFAGIVFANLMQSLRGTMQTAAVIALLGIICFSGYRSIRWQSPYDEYEDTLSILRQLAKSSTSGDQVWVNHDAAEAIDFYLQGGDRRFVYGKFHGDAPQEYVPELLGSIDRRTDRLWLVFSHLQQPSDYAEEQLIVNSLRRGWDVHSVIRPTNAELFVAERKISP